MSVKTVQHAKKQIVAKVRLILQTAIIVIQYKLVLNSAALTDIDQRIADLSLQIFVVQGPDKIPIVEELSKLGDESLIPTLVLAMRFTGSNIYVAQALSELTGETITDWHEAYQWQERHPNIVPHESFRVLKLRFLGARDNQFLSFFSPPYGTDEKMRIRLEEIVWGGVPYDGITSLDNPVMIDANDADYLLDTDLVFGVEINGDARAYPLRIMGWHEMANDVIGGVPVALAYCTFLTPSLMVKKFPLNLAHPVCCIDPIN